MKTIKYAFCFLIVSAFVLQSCSVEKRRYTSGYSLQWKSHEQVSSNRYQVSGNTKQLLPDTSLMLPVLMASSDKKKGVILLTVDSVGCDTLIMRDGTEIKVKVTEVTPTEIKYKFCNNTDGPTYVVYRYQVSYIKYRNGSMDSFINEHPPAQSVNKNYGFSSQSNFQANEYVRSTSTKSLVLGVVSFFISIFGIITAISAILDGAKCLRLIKQDPENLWMYKRTAKVGVILGSIYLGLIVVGITLVMLLTFGII